MTDTNLLMPLQTDAALTVSNLIEQRHEYNLNPPYQRGNVWDNKWKTDLIHTMIKKLPLAPVTLVQRDHDTGDLELLVLDGKQRISSVLDFIDGKYKLPITLPSKKVEQFSFSDIEKKARDKKYEFNAHLNKICSAFKNYNFKVVIYPNISWDDQIALFRTINHSKELSVYDRFNSDFIFAKSFAAFFFDNFMPDWRDFLKTKFSKRKNSTSGGDIFNQFRLVCALMGGDLSEPLPSAEKMPKPESTRRGELRRFVESLDLKISEYMTSNDDQYLFDSEERVDEMFKEFNWKKLQSNAKFYNKLYTSIFSDLDKEQRGYMYLLFYFSLIMCQKFHNGILTYNMLESEKDKILDVYKSYFSWAKENSDRTRRSGDLGDKEGSRKFHFMKIHELFDLSGIDGGKKNTEFTDDEKKAIHDLAGGKCEICGSTDDLEYDHVYPTSLSSKRVGGLLCGKHNRKKADNTSDSCKEIADYIEMKTAV